MKKIRCTKCESVFEVHNPEFVLRPDLRPESPVANPAPVMSGETTQMRHPGHDQDSPGETTKQYILSKLAKAPARSQNLKLPAAKKLSLAVISGGDSGRNFPIDKPRMVIGRTGSDIPLSDAEISRTHAAIEVEDDLVTLVDLGSTNGTFVGGIRIETALLENYGEFEVGGTTFMLIITGETI